MDVAVVRADESLQSLKVVSAAGSEPGLRSAALVQQARANLTTADAFVRSGRDKEAAETAGRCVNDLQPLVAPAVSTAPAPDFELVQALANCELVSAVRKAAIDPNAFDDALRRLEGASKRLDALVATHETDVGVRYVRAAITLDAALLTPQGAKPRNLEAINPSRLSFGKLIDENKRNFQFRNADLLTSAPLLAKEPALPEAASQVMV